MKARRGGRLGAWVRSAAAVLIAQGLAIALFMAVGRACRGPSPAAGGGRAAVQIIGDPDYGGEGDMPPMEESTDVPIDDDPDDDPEADPSPAFPFDFGVFTNRGTYVDSDSLKTWIPPEAVRAAARTHVGDCTVYVWPYDGPFGLAIYHRGALVYFKAEGRYYMPSETDRPGDYRYTLGPEPGRDIDGDGVPDLLIFYYTGGAHCCHDVLHFTCGDPPALRARISGWHSQPVYVDLDGDGRLEVRMDDTSYCYWNACYAASPRPEVVLRVHAGRYRLAPDLMKRAGPTPERIAAAAERLRRELALRTWYSDAIAAGAPPPKNDPVWDDRDIECWRIEGGAEIPAAVWGVMLDLIYSGRVEEAAAFLREVWPEGKRGQEEFMSDLAAEVLSSWFGSRLPWAGGLESWLRFEGPDEDVSPAEGSDP